MSTSPDSILALLRAREGEDLADLLPFAQPGAHVGLGRGVAVIGQAVGLGRAMDQTIAPFVTSLHQRISTTENDLGSGTGVAPVQRQSEASVPLAQGADYPAPLLSMLSRLEAETASLPPGILDPDLERRMDSLRGTLHAAAGHAEMAQTCAIPSDEAPLPPLEEHLAQVEALGDALREDQSKRGELAESLNTIELWLEQVGYRDGFVGVPVIEAVEVLVSGVKRRTADAAPMVPRGAGAGGDLLLVLEKIVREVIQRESVCGGIIARAIAEVRP